MPSRLLAAAALLPLSAAPPNAPHASVAGLLPEISEARIAAAIQKLEDFGSRNSNGIPSAPGRGIAAARDWLAAELRSYGPRLEVRLDAHPVQRGGRWVRDTEIHNVVAVLQGASRPGTQIVIGAHYDSLALVPREGGGIDWEKSAAAPLAPGAADNASGVACVLELARVLSARQWAKTIVFVLFSGEEQGLVGARAYARRAAAEKHSIEAVFNLDTIGTDVTGSGIQAGPRVNLYSGGAPDGPSRALARYIKQQAELYLPGFNVNTVFRADRFGRGGDHTPFEEAGFAAVRFTTPAEQLEHQHTPRDTTARVSMPYTALVTRATGAALAALASAPPAPRVSPLSRGASRYDAVLKWALPYPVSDLAGYSVLIRSTTAPFWEREIHAGQAETLTLENVLVDEIVLGVRAVNAAGIPSLVSAWTLPGGPVPADR
jgi:Zn-dependent M28 family amino/carboxypeptidase